MHKFGNAVRSGFRLVGVVINLIGLLGSLVGVSNMKPNKKSVHM